MKKISHLFFIFLPLFVSLFLYPSIVKADTYDISFNSSDFDILSSSTYNTIKNTADTYCSSNNCTYFLTYKSNQGYRANYYFLGNNSTTFIFSGTSSSMIYNIQGGGSWRSCRYNPTTGAEIACDINQSYPNADISFSFSNNSITSYTLLYSNLSSSALVLLRAGSESTNIYNLSYLNYSGSYSVNNPYIPSLYEIYQQANVVSDATPLLTQFFSISIEKLQTICDFIVSSYIYLAVIVIFLIYFSIYLLRRLK